MNLKQLPVADLFRRFADALENKDRADHRATFDPGNRGLLRLVKLTAAYCSHAMGIDLVKRGQVPAGVVDEALDLLHMLPKGRGLG